MTALYAFVLTTFIAAPGQPPAWEAMEIDRNLTFSDCAALVLAYTPTHDDLPGGLKIAHSTSCRIQR